MEKELILARLHAARLQKENIELKGILFGFQLREVESSIAFLEGEAKRMEAAPEQDAARDLAVGGYGHPA